MPLAKAFWLWWYKIATYCNNISLVSRLLNTSAKVRLCRHLQVIYMRRASWQGAPGARLLPWMPWTWRKKTAIFRSGKWWLIEWFPYVSMISYSVSPFPTFTSHVLPNKDWDVGSLGKSSIPQVWHCRRIPPSTRCLRCLQLLQMQFIQSLLSREAKDKEKEIKGHETSGFHCTRNEFLACWAGVGVFSGEDLQVMSDSISLLLRIHVAFSNSLTVLIFSLHMPTRLWSPSSAISGNVQCQCTL